MGVYRATSKKIFHYNDLYIQFYTQLIHCLVFISHWLLMEKLKPVWRQFQLWVENNIPSLKVGQV